MLDAFRHTARVSYRFINEETGYARSAFPQRHARHTAKELPWSVTPVCANSSARMIAYGIRQCNNQSCMTSISSDWTLRQNSIDRAILHSHQTVESPHLLNSTRTLPPVHHFDLQSTAATLPTTYILSLYATAISQRDRQLHFRMSSTSITPPSSARQRGWFDLPVEVRNMIYH
jgi:hypothetical protein